MITIFNRTELISAFSIREQALIREALQNNKIDYFLKTHSRISPGIAGRGSYSGTDDSGESMDLSCEYIFYVRRKDYGQALAIISGGIR